MKRFLCVLLLLPGNPDPKALDTSGMEQMLPPPFGLK